MATRRSRVAQPPSERAAPAAKNGESAAAPSPFPPIAEYAFLSDCHTGALVAPDGSIDWLCVPRFDSPSIFGSLLDREAGGSASPLRHQHPQRPAYRPGTNVMVTTWRPRPVGWWSATHS
jgi:GH15 family glucan-1,4-alpha-glucosidase